MKNIGKILFFSFLFLVTLFASEVVTVSAKSSSSEVFEVIVGDDKLPVRYTLVLDYIKVMNDAEKEVGSLNDNVIEMDDGKKFTIVNDAIYNESSESVGTVFNGSVLIINGALYTLKNSIEERMDFAVSLKGLDDTGNSYRWEHALCYKIEGKQEVCEIDLTGEDQIVEEGKDPIKILSNTTYNYTYFDEDMPYYNKDLEFEYITFKNKFVCLDCGEAKEVVLNDITFTKEEIDYRYKFGVVVQTYEKDGVEYVGYNPSGVLVNYYTSDYKLEGAQGYVIISEMCIDGEDCIKYSYNVYNKGSITPYLPNLRFYYEDTSHFKNTSASSVTLKTSVACITNCTDKRRVLGTQDAPFKLHEGIYNLYMGNPEFDENNSIISSMNEYAKAKEFKISVKDEFTGINEDGLFIYFAEENADGSCPVSIESYSKYKYNNGTTFSIGEGNSGSYCMYFEASNVMGNVYKSEYYHLKFDNTRPVVTWNDDYVTNGYYNEIVLSPVMNDSHSGIKYGYYLWTKEELTDLNYLKIKTEGKLYNGEISSISDELDDGTYNLYFLAYDNLENHQAYWIDTFNIDTTPLSMGDLEISSDLSDINYNNSGGVTVNVGEMSSGESYKCGFLNKNEVTVLDLNMNCMNGNKVSLPSSLEGEYAFYAYVKDRANNYSLFKIKENIKIDTKSPVIEYSALYDDNEYRVNNEITINVSDYNELNVSSMKYGWFLANKTNVLSSNLNSSFENNSKIYYPNSYYGEFKLYISVVDSVGNQTFMALDKVFRIDTDVVRISLVGENEVTILKGEKYIDLGAKAYKGQVGSNSRTSEVTVSGVVNTNKAGTYYLVYTSGEGDFAVSVTRKVIVKSDVPYLLISVGLFGVGMLVTGLRLFVRRKKEQNI